MSKHTPESYRYDHKKEPGAHGVCRRCGREHDPKKDAEEMAARAAIAKAEGPVMTPFDIRIAPQAAPVLPPVPAAELSRVMYRTLGFKVSDAQLESASRAAASAGLSLAEWLRQAAREKLARQEAGAP